jgi:hypothetical protein
MLWDALGVVYDRLQDGDGFGVDVCVGGGDDAATVDEKARAIVAAYDAVMHND